MDMIGSSRKLLVEIMVIMENVLLLVMMRYCTSQILGSSVLTVATT